MNPNPLPERVPGIARRGDVPAERCARIVEILASLHNRDQKAFAERCRDAAEDPKVARPLIAHLIGRHLTHPEENHDPDNDPAKPGLP